MRCFIAWIAVVVCLLLGTETKPSGIAFAFFALLAVYFLLSKIIGLLGEIKDKLK